MQKIVIKPQKGISGEKLVTEFKVFFGSFGIKDIIINFDSKTGLVILKDVSSWRRGFNSLNVLLSSKCSVVSCQEPEYSAMEAYDMSNLPGVNIELVDSFIMKGQKLGLMKEVSEAGGFIEKPAVQEAQV